MTQPLRGWWIYSEPGFPFHFRGFPIMVPKDWGKLISQSEKVSQFVYFLARQYGRKAQQFSSISFSLIEDLHPLLCIIFPQGELLVLASPTFYQYFLLGMGLFKTTQGPAQAHSLEENERSPTARAIQNSACFWLCCLCTSWAVVEILPLCPKAAIFSMLGTFAFLANLGWKQEFVVGKKGTNEYLYTGILC